MMKTRFIAISAQAAFVAWAVKQGVDTSKNPFCEARFV
jgi:hypothetical protein